MAQIESFASVELIINGHRFTSWADEDPPLEFEFESSSDRKRGADGGLYAKGMPVYGGMMTFKMFPTSPTTQWAMQREQTRKDAHFSGIPQEYFNGTYSNPITGTSYRLEGGIIDIFPAVAIPGLTYEGTIDFEVITSLVDGGTFNPPRATSAPAPPPPPTA